MKEGKQTNDLKFEDFLLAQTPSKFTRDEIFARSGFFATKFLAANFSLEFEVQFTLSEIFMRIRCKIAKEYSDCPRSLPLFFYF